jgi:hypothetical protein
MLRQPQLRRRGDRTWSNVPCAQWSLFASSSTGSHRLFGRFGVAGCLTDHGASDKRKLRHPVRARVRHRRGLSCHLEYDAATNLDCIICIPLVVTTEQRHIYGGGNTVLPLPVHEHCEQVSVEVVEFAVIHDVMQIAFRPSCSTTDQVPPHRSAVSGRCTSSSVHRAKTSVPKRSGTTTKHYPAAVLAIRSSTTSERRPRRRRNLRCRAADVPDASACRVRSAMSCQSPTASS